MEINKGLFRRLNEYFKDNIKLSHVAQNNVLIVTKDDKVYQFDRFVKQTYYSIAYTSDESMIEKFIEKSILFELCDKQVVDFRCSAIHTIARTIDGKIYVWGKNDGGILGNGFEDENIYEPKLNEYLKHLNITDMSCGVFHSLVLTSSGDIYSWGNNEFGQTGNGIKGGYQLKPYKMNFSVPEKFKAISCGTFHSMALSTSGRVYSCGFNFYGELGYGNNENLNKIKIIKMDNIIIEKISCGNSHSLMLSNEGDIYVSGCYETDGSEFRENQPLKLNNPNKFLDIKTLYNKKICAALSSNGFYYIWGKCEANDGIRLEPKETTYKSFNDIFIDFYQKTYEPIKGMINRFVDGLIQNKHYITLYKEKEKLGEGSYGVVFKANVKMNENFTFAVKKIKFNTKYEKEILKELEIHSLISRINHKNIVRFEEYWIENNDIKKSGVKTSTLFFRMELCDKTLDQFLEKFHTNSKFNGTLFKYYISSAIFVEILEGVNYLHKNEPQIIHRDLRPDNILMNLDENSNVSVKIADFGLVTIHKYAEQLHEGDRGHIRYAAPEVLDGEIYDTKADIYSLGKVLKDIFGIDFDDFEDYLNGIKVSSILMNRYKKINDLYRKMVSKLKDERPDCEEIIRDEHKWALKANEFKAKNEIDHIANFETDPYILSFIRQLKDQIRKINFYFNGPHLNNDPVLIPANLKKFLENKYEHDITFASSGHLKRNSDFKIKFEELSKLGEGIFGEVIKIRVKKDFAEFEEPEIQAIKKVDIIYSEELKLYETFRDFLTLINLNNERVVKCFDAWFEIDNHLNELYLFLRTELCDGNLKTLIEDIRNNPLMKGKHCLTLSGYCLASDLLIEILEAVNYLHKRKPTIIHGNLKPENILFKKVNNSMFIKIADTGLRVIEEFSLRRQVIVREERYSAPEVLNYANFETKSDIFSLGIITKELFDIDLNKEYNSEDDESTLIMCKYHKMKNLCFKMIEVSPHLRPDCEQILKNQHLWAINEIEN